MGLQKQNFIGKEYITNEGYKIIVIDGEGSKNLTIKFEDGTVVYGLNTNNLRSGLKHKNHKSINGIGYIGYGKYSNKTHKKYYDVWVNMIRRCYDKTNIKFKSYVDCNVSEEWHNFQNFALWFENNTEYVVGFELDKDLKIKGNKTYSSLTCTFLPSEINGALRTIQNNKNSDLPVGIDKYKTNSGFSFRSKCQIEKYQTISKTFDNLDDAKNHYILNKESYMKRLSEKYKHLLSEDVYILLQNWKVY